MRQAPANAWRRLRYFGLARQCPLCRSHVRLFLPHGVVPRPNAVCPVCFSRDRHRLAWLWMQAHTPIGKVPIRLLHVAPETVVAQQLQALPLVHYVSGDLVHRASVHMDICRMPFRDNSFDVVYCSHVLNMLPDDKPAMADLFRVLSPGGLALLQVPKPLEGPGIEVGAGSSAPERRALLGDPDMYRRYGKDMLAGRLLQAGFEHQVVDWFHSFRDREQRRMGLIDEPLQVCIKPHSS